MSTKLKVFASLVLLSIAASLAFPPPGGSGSLKNQRSNSIKVEIPYEVLVDMEDTGASDGTDITSIIATNMTSLGIGLMGGGNSNAWLVISNGAVVTSTIRMEIDTNQKARGTRSMRTDATTDYTYLEFRQASSNAVMSIGFAFWLDANWTGATFNSYNLLVWTSSTGEFMNFNLFDNPGFEFALQTLAGLSTAITGLSNQTWYWVTMKWDQGGDATMRIYTYVSGGLGTLLGEKTMALQADYPQFIEIGREDNHDVFNSGAWWNHDDLIIDFQGTFPLSAP